MNELKQIQTQVFRLGLLTNDDAIKKLMAFIADPIIGSLCYAQRIFNYIENRSLFVYNVMIRAYTKNGGFSKALSLFDQMRLQGLWPDNYTYPFVFRAVGCLREVLIGEKIRGFVVKCGVEFDCYVCNSVMDMYGQVGCVGSMKKLFDEMPERDLVSWNILLSGYVRCKKFEDAVGVYLRMREEGGVRPDEATVVSTLSACIALKNLKLGKEIHRYLISELEFTTIIGNALLDMYSKCGCLNVARQIFDGMPRKNVICWTSIVSGYVSCGQLEEARVLFERSPVKDIILWTAMINGYVQFNRVDEAMTMFRRMQIERIRPDKFTVVSLLTGCAQLGALEQGKWIHEYMEENQIHIDAVAGTALIEMYAKCGCIAKSLEIFYDLKEKDTASWTSIIGALSMNGKTSKALELFSAMKRAGFKPDDVTFIGVLNACSHGGLVEEGQRHFESIKNLYRIEPKIEHYWCLIDILGRAGLLYEAEELVDKITDENNEMIVSLYGALLSACRIYGNVDMGERLAKRFMEMEYSDSSVHTLLANIYASAGRWEEVAKVRKKMRALGVKKEPGCSSIEVNGNVHEFLAGDASHPKIEEVYSVLNGLLKPSSGFEESEIEQTNLRLVNVW